jgi:diguanylate cyclase (GGDEF)-like protein
MARQWPMEGLVKRSHETEQDATDSDSDSAKSTPVVARIVGATAGGRAPPAETTDTGAARWPIAIACRDDEYAVSDINGYPVASSRWYCLATFLIPIALMLLGIAVLSVGWWGENRQITSFFQNFPTMKANTAISIALLGVCLYAMRRRRHRVLLVSAGAVLLISGLTIVEHLGDIDLAFDELFARDPWSPVTPGRMPLATAGTVYIAGTLMLAARSWPKTLPLAFDLLFLCGFSLPLLALFAYLVDPSGLFEVGPFSSKSVPTTLGMIAFYVCLGLLVDSAGLVGFVTRNSRGGRWFRMMILPVTIIPGSLGLLLENAVVANQIGVAFGLSLFSLAAGYITLLTLGWGALRLDQADDTALFDYLTRVRNRRAFDSRMAITELRGHRRHAKISLMILDIDHFKRVNDSLGHGAGDAVLKEFVYRVELCLRISDVIYRYGGEEFVILADNLDDTGARALGDRICERIRERPVAVSGASVPLTCSIGISTPGEDEHDLYACLRRADEALYAAKEQGRDRVVLQRPPVPPVIVRKRGSP